MRVKIALVCAVLAVIAISTGWAASRTQPDARTSLVSAAEVFAPDMRLTYFTDWAKARSVLGDRSLETVGQRETFLDRAHERDLSYRSILDKSAPQLSELFGWSPSTISWEAFGQSSQGSLLAIGMGGVDTGRFESRLADRGFDNEDGIWRSAGDNYARQAPGLTDQLSNIAVVDADNLLIASNDIAYLREAVARHQNHGRSLADIRPVRGVLAALRGSVAALIVRSGDACALNSLADAGDAAKAQAHQLVKPLGTLESYERFGQGLLPTTSGQLVRYALEFDSAAQAGRQTDIRRQLTSGPIVGRVARFGDFMTFSSAGVRGNTGILDFAVDTPTDSALTQIGSGPFLPSACATNEKPTDPFISP